MRYGFKKRYGINTEQKKGDRAEIKRKYTNDNDEEDIMSVDRL